MTEHRPIEFAQPTFRCLTLERGLEFVTPFAARRGTDREELHQACRWSTAVAADALSAGSKTFFCVRLKSLPQSQTIIVGVTVVPSPSARLCISCDNDDSPHRGAPGVGVVSGSGYVCEGREGVWNELRQLRGIAQATHLGVFVDGSGLGAPMLSFVGFTAGGGTTDVLTMQFPWGLLNCSAYRAAQFGDDCDGASKLRPLQLFPAVSLRLCGDMATFVGVEEMRPWLSQLRGEIGDAFRARFCSPPPSVLPSPPGAEQQAAVRGCDVDRLAA